MRDVRIQRQQHAGAQLDDLAFLSNADDTFARHALNRNRLSSLVRGQHGPVAQRELLNFSLLSLE